MKSKVDSYPKTYVRVYTDLNVLMGVINRSDFQNSIVGREFNFEHTIAIGDDEYILTIVVSRVDGRNNRDTSREV